MMEFNVARWFWRRLYRELRLLARAEEAELDHRIMHGDPTKATPRGALNCGGLRGTVNEEED